MKKTLVILLLFFACKLYAQECKVNLSNEFENKNDFGYVHIYKIGNSFYSQKIERTSPKIRLFSYNVTSLKKTNYGITLYKYDDNMNEVKKAALDNGEKTFGPFAPTFITFNNKLLLFYYRYADDETIHLNVAEVSQTDLTLKAPKEIYIYSQKNVGFIKLQNMLDLFNLSVNVSPDKSKMLLVQSMGNEANCIVLDANLNITNQNDIKKEGMENFEFSSVLIDNDDNQYFAYRYMVDKQWNAEIIVKNKAGKQAKLHLNIKEDGKMASVFRFKNSFDNKSVFLYGNYAGDQLSEGIFLTTVDPISLKLSKVILYPYSDEFKKRLYKMDFGARKKDNYSVKETSYELNQLANGTIMLTGSPFYIENFSRTSSPTGNISSTSYYNYGPILNIAINNNNNNSNIKFTILPRKQKNTFEGSECIFLPYNDKLVCIYNDLEKNINNELKDDVKECDEPNELNLAMTTFGSDGSIGLRKQIAENAIGKNYFFTSNTQKISDNKLIIPVGRDKVGFASRSTEIVQWADLEIK